MCVPSEEGGVGGIRRTQEHYTVVTYRYIPSESGAGCIVEKSSISYAALPESPLTVSGGGGRQDENKRTPECVWLGVKGEEPELEQDAVKNLVTKPGAVAQPTGTRGRAQEHCDGGQHANRSEHRS